MTFDELQKTWQSQQSSFRLSVDSDMLLREVKRNKKSFETTVFWRDVREGGGSLVMAVVILYFGGIKGIMWPFGFWPLLPVALLVAGVGVFIIADRIMQKKKQPVLTESLASCIETSLAEVKHQIWLLKNVIWWYFLPFTVAIAIVYTYIAWKLREVGSIVFLTISGLFAATVLAYWGGYHLNQWAVRKKLNPRKAELEQLLDSLEKD